MLVGAIILGLASAGAGLIGRGFERGRSADRVTVKGLAESFVTADLAVWPLRITATGEDLARVQEQIDRDLSTVSAFLTEQDIEPEAIQPQRVEVTDLLAQPYRPEGVGDNRFIVAQTIIVRTEQVDRVARLNQQTGELVKRGVVLADTGGPTYLFTRLNEIKPEMLAEATRNARVSAEQFAVDSGSALAEIRRASQGLFEILPRSAPVSWSRTRWTRRSGWSVRSSTGWPTDAPGAASAEAGRQNGLSTTCPGIGAGQPDVAQHVIAELASWWRWRGRARSGRSRLHDLRLADRSRAYQRNATGGQDGRRTRLDCMGTILLAHRLHPC